MLQDTVLLSKHYSLSSERIFLIHIWQFEYLWQEDCMCGIESKYQGILIYYLQGKK